MYGLCVEAFETFSLSFFFWLLSLRLERERTEKMADLQRNKWSFFCEDD